MLTGTALTAEARRLAIPGRSRMTAGELRAAIAALTAPVPPQVPQVPQVATRTPVAPWRSTRGKHKHTPRNRCGFRR